MKNFDMSLAKATYRNLTLNDNHLILDEMHDVLVRNSICNHHISSNELIAGVERIRKRHLNFDPSEVYEEIKDGVNRDLLCIKYSIPPITLDSIENLDHEKDIPTLNGMFYSLLGFSSLITNYKAKYGKSKFSLYGGSVEISGRLIKNKLNMSELDRVTISGSFINSNYDRTISSLKTSATKAYANNDDLLSTDEVFNKWGIGLPRRQVSKIGLNGYIKVRGTRIPYYGRPNIKSGKINKYVLSYKIKDVIKISELKESMISLSTIPGWITVIKRRFKPIIALRDKHSDKIVNVNGSGSFVQSLSDFNLMQDEFIKILSDHYHKNPKLAIFKHLKETGYKLPDIAA